MNQRIFQWVVGLVSLMALGGCVVEPVPPPGYYDPGYSPVIYEPYLYPYYYGHYGFPRYHHHHHF